MMYGQVQPNPCITISYLLIKVLLYEFTVTYNAFGVNRRRALKILI